MKSKFLKFIPILLSGIFLLSSSVVLAESTHLNTTTSFAQSTNFATTTAFPETTNFPHAAWISPVESALGGFHIQVLVKTISHKTISLDCYTSDTIYAVKSRIEAKEGLHPEFQRLIYFGKEMENGRTLADYNVHNEAVIYLVLKL
ncbi:ubiquitin-like protein [Longirhabdus pacifica]|uniref:ubiquitin-like protein n=1 Tax=Longirhabdus pacifica TaxID=2305227 RepID=UPI0010087577|nr:ubiquitin-like protein [Longirhabdus pacifica]